MKLALSLALTKLLLVEELPFLLRWGLYCREDFDFTFAAFPQPATVALQLHIRLLQRLHDGLPLANVQPEVIR